MKLLRKHGLVEGGGGHKRRPAAAGAPCTRADDMDLFDEGAVGAVPQPQPQLVMQQLQDIQKAYGALRLGTIGNSRGLLHYKRGGQGEGLGAAWDQHSVSDGLRCPG